MQENLEGFAGVSRPVRSVAVDVPHHPIASPPRDVWPHLLQRRDLVAQVRCHHFHPGRPIEWIASGQRMVINATDGIHVGPRIQGGPLKLLGAHEENRAKHRIRGFQMVERGGLDQLGQAEINDFDLELAGGQPSEHQVAGFQVAVHQIELMGGDEGFLGLQGQFTKVRPSQRGPLDEFIQRFAADQFHHHIGPILIGPHVVNRDDVRMLQQRQRTGFLDDLLRGGLALGGFALLLDALDGHLAVHAGVKRPIHRAHAALANFFPDFVTLFHEPVEVGGGLAAAGRSRPTMRPHDPCGGADTGWGRIRRSGRNCG